VKFRVAGLGRASDWDTFDAGSDEISRGFEAKELRETPSFAKWCV